MWRVKCVLRTRFLIHWSDNSSTDLSDSTLWNMSTQTIVREIRILKFCGSAAGLLHVLERKNALRSLCQSNITFLRSNTYVCMVSLLSNVANRRAKCCLLVQFFLKKTNWGHQSFLWGTDTPVVGDVYRGFQSQDGSPARLPCHPLAIDSPDSPLVQHLLTS